MTGSRLPLVLALLAILLYLPTLGGEFLRDDLQLLMIPGWLEGFSLTDVLFDNGWNNVAGESYYRPVIFLSHRLDQALWGSDPAGHHLTNLVAYAALAFVLALLGLRLGFDPAVSALCTVLFIAHPSHVEVVAWISGRSDLLAALFALTYTLWLRPPYLPRHPPPSPPPHPLTQFTPFTLTSPALLLLAIGSKEVAFSLLLALLVLHPGALLRRGLLFNALTWILPLLAYALLRSLALGPPDPSLLTASPVLGWQKALMSLKLVGRYLTVLLLGVDYGPLEYQTLRWSDAWGPETLLSLLALLGFAPWALGRWRRGGPDRFALLMGTGALLLCQVPVFLGKRIMFEDRYLFFTSLAFTLLLASTLSERLPALPSRSRRVALGFLAGLGSLWTLRTLEKSRNYLSLRSYFEYAARMDPESPMAHRGLGVALIRDGFPEEGEAELEHALARFGRIAEFSYLIESKLDRGRLAEAVDLAVKWTGHSLHPFTAARLSQAAARLGRFREGIGFARGAVAADPRDSQARMGLALNLAGDGQIEAAVVLYRRLLAETPGSVEATVNLALLLARTGRGEQARELVRDARQKGVDTRRLDLVLALILEGLGDLDGAREALEPARSDPGLEALVLLREASLLERRGLRSEARVRYERARKLGATDADLESRLQAPGVPPIPPR